MVRGGRRTQVPVAGPSRGAEGGTARDARGTDRPVGGGSGAGLAGIIRSQRSLLDGNDQSAFVRGVRALRQVHEDEHVAERVASNGDSPYRDVERWSEDCSPGLFDLPGSFVGRTYKPVRLIAVLRGENNLRVAVRHRERRLADVIVTPSQLVTKRTGVEAKSGIEVRDVERHGVDFAKECVGHGRHSRRSSRR